MVGDVLLFSHEAMLEHEPGSGHPERPQRLRSICEALEGEPVPNTRWAAPRPARRELLERVHHPAYVDSLEALRGSSAALDVDTAVSRGSLPAAFLAAGAAVDAVSAVVDGHALGAFALIRPPGHHAEAGRAMGFCLFNNVAVAAAHARDALGCERVLLVDWDVHHGNGTQHAFYGSRDVLFFSTHRFPFYPGTGALREVGEGDGRGFTVNVPLPAGFGDPEYRAIFAEVLVPIANAFEPDMVLVSAGFDAHRRDPLGGMAVTEGGFASLCGLVAAIAGRHARGRLALVLEGGYDLAALAGSVRACVEVLAGAAPPEPGPARHQAAEIIAAVRETHRTFWPL